MNFFLEDHFTSEEYEEKKRQLTVQRNKIMMEIEEHNKGDDSFNQRMIDVIQIAANAHKTFLLSNNEKKSQLIKLVFSTVKLNGQKLEFMLRPPFDSFIKTREIEEWRALVYDFLTSDIKNDTKIAVFLMNQNSKFISQRSTIC